MLERPNQSYLMRRARERVLAEIARQMYSAVDEIQLESLVLAMDRQRKAMQEVMQLTSELAGAALSQRR